jgi:hypothetical protein
MAIRRPQHRRWLVRRRRFLDTEGGQVTDTWFHFPLLPRRILTWRSPDRSEWHVHWSPSPMGDVLLAVLVLVGLVWNIFRVVGTGQWVTSIPNDLAILWGLGILTVLTWRAAHRRERAGTRTTTVVINHVRVR